MFWATSPSPFSCSTLGDTQRPILGCWVVSTYTPQGGLLIGISLGGKSDILSDAFQLDTYLVWAGSFRIRPVGGLTCAPNWNEAPSPLGRFISTWYRKGTIADEEQCLRARERLKVNLTQASLLRHPSSTGDLESRQARNMVFCAYD